MSVSDTILSLLISFHSAPSICKLNFRDNLNQYSFLDLILVNGVWEMYVRRHEGKDWGNAVKEGDRVGNHPHWGKPGLLAIAQMAQPKSPGSQKDWWNPELVPQQSFEQVSPGFYSKPEWKPGLATTLRGGSQGQINDSTMAASKCTRDHSYKFVELPFDQ